MLQAAIIVWIHICESDDMDTDRSEHNCHGYNQRRLRQVEQRPANSLLPVRLMQGRRPRRHPEGLVRACRRRDDCRSSRACYWVPSSSVDSCLQVGANRRRENFVTKLMLRLMEVCVSLTSQCILVLNTLLMNKEHTRHYHSIQHTLSSTPNHDGTTDN